MDNIILEAHPEGPDGSLLQVVTQRNSSRLVYQLKAKVVFSSM